MTTETETKTRETETRSSIGGRAGARGARLASEAEARVRQAEGIAQNAQSQAVNVFEQAVQTFGDAVKAGVKIQEDIARWWTDVFDQAGAMQSWQKRSRAFVNDAIPAVQQNAEDWLRVAEQNYRRGIDLMKMAMESEQPPSGAAARGRSQELWEAGLQFLREGAQSLAQVQVKMMEQWSDIIRRNVEGEQEQ